MAEQIIVPELPASGDYSVAVRRRDGVVQLSGLNGTRADGFTPESAGEQADIILDHLERVLAAAGLAVRDVFAARVYATSHRAANDWIVVRRRRMSAPWPASTVLLVERLYDPRWHLEVEFFAEPAGLA